MRTESDNSFHHAELLKERVLFSKPRLITFASFVILLWSTTFITTASADSPIFRPGQSLAAGKDPFSVTTGDFNRDGHLDLAVANAASDNVSVLLNLGQGKFGGATNFPAGRTPRAIVAADLSGDGNVD